MVYKNSTPSKPPNNSTITLEECEDLHNQVSKLEEKINKLNNRSITHNYLVNMKIKIQQMENKMNENREHMENKMYENRE
jgi:predicted  nucleic acid-binding Zn-ribbon protein